ncbi:hypothetical protein POM88_014589 [Heracleum sosnowskyi]|uniref:Uncharacterized protein n=1 Tax=Heracleum sosnowskyi TaxID=360622 RepID=A0AAD8IK59_9APIA|nr:hypothetical protein POM88_014589 [Heracleum sosnowskyi]
MAETLRFHLVKLRLLFARREAIDAAIGLVQVELEQIEEARIALSHLVLDIAHEGNYELLKSQNIQILVLNNRYHQVEMNGRPHHITEKFDAVFKPRIAVARFVEVENVDDATYLVNLRAVEGWEDDACIDDGFVPEEERLQIAQTLQQGLVPLRHFQRDAKSDSGVFCLIY